MITSGPEVLSSYVLYRTLVFLIRNLRSLRLCALRYHDLALAQLLFACLAIWNIHLGGRNEKGHALEVGIQFYGGKGNQIRVREIRLCLRGALRHTFEWNTLRLWEECLRRCERMPKDDRCCAMVYPEEQRVGEPTNCEDQVVLPTWEHGACQNIRTPLPLIGIRLTNVIEGDGADLRDHDCIPAVRKVSIYS